MRYICLLLLSLTTLAAVSRNVQSPEPNRRGGIAAVVERRLQTQQPVELSADSIALTGTVLHLKGQVRILWLPDTVIRAEEARINEGRVELIGDVHASFGSSSGEPFTPPRIEYR